MRLVNDMDNDDDDVKNVPPPAGSFGNLFSSMSVPVNAPSGSEGLADVTPAPALSTQTIFITSLLPLPPLTIASVLRHPLITSFINPLPPLPLSESLLPTSMPLVPPWLRLSLLIIPTPLPQPTLVSPYLPLTLSKEIPLVVQQVDQVLLIHLGSVVVLVIIIMVLVVAMSIVARIVSLPLVVYLRPSFQDGLVVSPPMMVLVILFPSRIDLLC